MLSNFSASRRHAASMRASASVGSGPRSVFERLNAVPAPFPDALDPADVLYLLVGVEPDELAAGPRAARAPLAVEPLADVHRHRRPAREHREQLSVHPAAPIITSGACMLADPRVGRAGSARCKAAVHSTTHPRAIPRAGGGRQDINVHGSVGLPTASRCSTATHSPLGSCGPACTVVPATPPISRPAVFVPSCFGPLPGGPPSLC